MPKSLLKQVWLVSHICDRYCRKTCPVSSLSFPHCLPIIMGRVWRQITICFHPGIVSLIMRQCVHAWAPTGWWGVAWESCSPPGGCFVQHPQPQRSDGEELTSAALWGEHRTLLFLCHLHSSQGAVLWSVMFYFCVVFLLLFVRIWGKNWMK